MPSCAGIAPDKPGLLQDLGWTLAQVVPDLKTLLPAVAPGHYSCGYGFLPPQHEVEGLVIAMRT